MLKWWWCGGVEQRGGKRGSLWEVRKKNIKTLDRTTNDNFYSSQRNRYFSREKNGGDQQEVLKGISLQNSILLHHVSSEKKV